MSTRLVIKNSIAMVEFIDRWLKMSIAVIEIIDWWLRLSIADWEWWSLWSKESLTDDCYGRKKIGVWKRSSKDWRSRTSTALIEKFGREWGEKWDNRLVVEIIDCWLRMMVSMVQRVIDWRLQWSKKDWCLKTIVQRLTIQNVNRFDRKIRSGVRRVASRQIIHEILH